MLCSITAALPFSFPFPLSPSPTVKNMFYIWVCIWSCLFLCTCLSFASIFHVQGKTWSFCFWAWLISLNMMSSNCIHLSSNHAVKLHCAYITHFLDPFISRRASGLFPKLGYCEQCSDVF
jgi:hypothetical protein